MICIATCILWLALSSSWATIVQGQYGFCFKNYYNSFGTLRDRRAVQRRQATLVGSSQSMSGNLGPMPSSASHVVGPQGPAPSAVIYHSGGTTEGQNDVGVTDSEVFISQGQDTVIGGRDEQESTIVAGLDTYSAGIDTVSAGSDSITAGISTIVIGLGTIDLYVNDGKEPRLGVHAKVINPTTASVMDENFTDKTGHIMFRVPAGSYNVEVTIPSGESVQTGPQDGVFESVPVGQANTTSLALSFLPPVDTSAVILVVKDENGDPVPAGTQFDIVSLSGAVDQTVETMSDDGKILVTAVVGTYTVEPHGDDYVLMQPNNTIVFISSEAETAANDQDEAIIIVVPTSRIGTISGTVYYDGNNNEVSDGGEGVAEVEVEIRSIDGGAVGKKLRTNSTGGYTFPMLTPGEYKVTIGAILGYKIPGTMGRSMDLLLEERSEKLYDFRIPPKANITGFVYEDMNLNHTPDESEGRKGYDVKMLDGDGITVAVTTTKPDGSYELVDVISEQVYTIKVADKTGNSKTESTDVPREGVYTINLEIDPCCSSPFQAFEGDSWKAFDAFDMPQNAAAAARSSRRM